MGNNDNSPMSRIASGVTGATPIFNKIMTNLLKDSPAQAWNIPDGLKKETICFSHKKPDSDEVVTYKISDWVLKEDSVVGSCNIKPDNPNIASAISNN